MPTHTLTHVRMPRRQEFNCGWRNNQIHDGESKAYAASFLLRTINKLRSHSVDALSWWTFSSIFEEGGLPTNEFGPFGANSALQTVHGVPLPIYRGFELLAEAGDMVYPVYMSPENPAMPPAVEFNQSGPLNVMPTLDLATHTWRVYLSNFAPDDGKKDAMATRTSDQDVCYRMIPNPCNRTSCYLPETDFPGGDLLPEVSG